MVESNQAPDDFDVFISYSRRDERRVMEIEDRLAEQGIALWRDKRQIVGGDLFMERIVSAIDNCKAVLLMCSIASMRSRFVQTELLLAWTAERLIVPLLLDDSIPTTYPGQARFCTAGLHWIEVRDHPVDLWLPCVEEALTGHSIGTVAVDLESEGPADSARPKRDLSTLWNLASLSDEIWPVPASAAESRHANKDLGYRDLGEEQYDLQRAFRVGSYARIAVESPVEGHLLLLDKGTSGKTYCLCPSRFAPDTRIRPGRNYYPQPSEYDAFKVTGLPGQESLLALISQEPLGLDWLPGRNEPPARVLEETDVARLIDRLCNIPCDKWAALSSYFEIERA